MLLEMVITSTSRGRGLSLLPLGVLLAVTLPGCILSSGEPVNSSLGAVEPTVDLLADGFALPDEVYFESYWYSRAPELHPIEEADVILAGTVDAVSAASEMEGEAFNRVVPGWLTHAEFRVSWSVKGTEPGEERTYISYFTPKAIPSVSLGPGPQTLGRGVSYLLLLRAPQLRVGGRDDPPPIPLAVVDAAACGQCTAPEMMTALLVASVRAPETDLEHYAIPVLGYLAQFHGQEDARAALTELSESGEEPSAAAAFRALTAWGQYAEGGLELLRERSRDSSPTVRGVAIAGRIRLQDDTVFGDLAAWCRHPGLPDQVVKLVGRELEVLPPQEMTEELLRQFEELLGPDMPVVVRYGISRQLRQVGTQQIVPLLIKAIDDPDLEVGYQAMVGLYRAAGGPGHPEMRAGCVGPEEFSADSQRYITFWKEWWETASRHGWPPPRPEPTLPPSPFGEEP